MNNIILCGFMGSGKTVVGKRLARALEMEYIDLDAEIESQAGKPIPEIFAESGEEGFRRLEHEAVCALSKRVRCVVATGGGALTFSHNVQAIDQQDSVVFLDADFAVCYERIRDSDRPLVRKNDKDSLRELYWTRYTAYRKAAAIAVNANSACDAVVEAITAALPAFR